MEYLETEQCLYSVKCMDASEIPNFACLDEMLHANHFNKDYKSILHGGEIPSDRLEELYQFLLCMTPNRFCYQAFLFFNRSDTENKVEVKNLDQCYFFLTQ